MIYPVDSAIQRLNNRGLVEQRGPVWPIQDVTFCPEMLFDISPVNFWSLPEQKCRTTQIVVYRSSMMLAFVPAAYLLLIPFKRLA